MLKVAAGNLISMAIAGQFDVIVHGCNCYHAMGGGIAREVKDRLPEAYQADKATGKGDLTKIGAYSSANVTRNGHDFVVVNAYTQEAPSSGDDVFEYAGFETVLKYLAVDYPNARIGIPLIGAGLARGDAQRILLTMHQAAQELDLTLVLFDGSR